MAEVPSELLQTLTEMLVGALRTSATSAAEGISESQQQRNTGTVATGQPKPPPFSMSEYRSSGGSSIADYFKRFSWALELSNVPLSQYANYARVYMGSKLNDALKFLVSPQIPEELSFEEIKTKLIVHFGSTRNKYAESIKFRQSKQNRGESVANFALRLRQAAVYCEYDTFLDRMLIEQFLFGLESREMCDEIIAKKPATFTEAYQIAHSLEATHNKTTE